MAVTGRVKRVAICPDCAETLFEKIPKAITKLMAVCNGCGREQYCSLVETTGLSLRKDRKVKKTK